MVSFAVKTPPQHGTWAQSLDVWRGRRRNRGVRVGLDDGSLLPAHAADGRDPSRELDDAGRARPGDEAAAPRLMVNGMHYRHPAVTANAAVTVDHISGLCLGLEPKPLQARLPIVVGGKGPQRTLRTVARFALMMFFSNPNAGA
jgi:hypothetical protein